MKTNIETNIGTTDKKVYRSPEIERITLDNEISLELESPASLPLWSENQNNSEADPFKTNRG